MLTMMKKLIKERIEVKDKVILALNYSNEVYLNNIHNKLKIVELEDYLNNL